MHGATGSGATGSKDSGGRGLSRDFTRRSFVATLAASAPLLRAHAADAVRLGMLRTLSPAPFYMAQERGYFRDEGIEVTFRFFEAAQPIAAAAVSNDIDIGVTALTGGFFNLAEKGILKVIGGGLHEQKGYEGSAILVSNAAYDMGVTSVEKLGGHSFAQHASYVKAFEADPADPKGHAYKARLNPLTGEKKDFSLREALEITDWDVVTIQQVSNNSYKYDTFQPDAGILIAYVRKYAPKAEILIHETWSYPPDFLAKGKYNVDQQSMYDQLHAAYQKLSEESGGLRIIPVGTAFQAARGLPTPMNLNAPGDKHANTAGQYLGGAVFYEALFHDSVEAVDFVPPKGLKADQAKALRQIAHETMAKAAAAPAKKP